MAKEKCHVPVNLRLQNLLVRESTSTICTMNKKVLKLSLLSRPPFHIYSRGFEVYLPSRVTISSLLFPGELFFYNFAFNGFGIGIILTALALCSLTTRSTARCSTRARFATLTLLTLIHRLTNLLHCGT